MDIHPTAAAGFSSVAALYERARPGYPPAAIDWIRERTGLGPGSTVVDLGAGTGKLTRVLTAAGARVIAVEPLPEMMAELRRAVPDAEPVEGTAEAIPLPGGSADVVTAGQAFHWFDPERALVEIHRVLVAAGWVALIWNSRGVEDLQNAAIDELLRPYRRDLLPAREYAWRDAVASSPLFGDLEHRSFDNFQSSTREQLRERFASTSFVAALPAAERERLLERIVAVSADRPEPFTIPYVTDVFTFPRSRDLVS